MPLRTVRHQLDDGTQLRQHLQHLLPRLDHLLPLGTRRNLKIVLLGRLTRTTDTAPGPARLKERLQRTSPN